jgi:hypothetical protein
MQGLYNHGFYVESACFVLALAAVHHSARLSSNCLDNLHTGLRLLQQLGPNEPAQSTSAAVEQMIARIRALPARPESSAGQADANDVPYTTAANPPNPTNHLASFVPNTSILDPTLDTLTPISWDNNMSLDDIWSMMDWNVGFLSMDPTSSMPAPGL